MLDELLERGSGLGPIAHVMPDVEHRLGEQLQCFPESPRLGTMGLKSSELPEQMCPAELPPCRVHPAVGAPTVRDQDPGERRAEQLLRNLGASPRANEEQRHVCRNGSPQPGALA